MGARDQTFLQPALTAQPFLEPSHAAVVVLVVVAEKVQQPVQGEHAQFGQLRVARIAGLAAGDAARDHDIA